VRISETELRIEAMTYTFLTSQPSLSIPTETMIRTGLASSSTLWSWARSSSGFLEWTTRTWSA